MVDQAGLWIVRVDIKKLTHDSTSLFNVRAAWLAL
ncbi:hypothetical protein YPC_1839 [Yersinia pestis biovar Medievalis str. Harbin 35]|nr:hypothetical protein YPC_1839 [Yersinia pestis biovar Medievalis str. Harbin 35]EEO77133.1 hypothetical protein YP516_1868 [Yersinia pestis Nepal516]EEO80642.1 hypothetical protein YPF_2712 [Yersinia pestis biovar Orientalis str. India 195]EEO84024.1 hypothetical protein YPH_4672 [Yersinia pestis biovar Orientalis str. PEXU2]EEO90011.1 hypothetical protein YPS_2673 [Yersinia pestis Pestoides A]